MFKDGEFWDWVGSLSQSQAGAFEEAKKQQSLIEWRNRLPEVLALEGGLTIWCRNGAICENATPCKNLDCPFKKARESDIIDGTHDCRNFVIALGSGPWYTAKLRFDNNLLRIWM